MFLVEHRHHVAIFKSGLELTSSFKTRFLERVPHDRVEAATAQEDAIFEKIRLRNMSTSRLVLRSKTLEGQNLSNSVGTSGASRYAPQSYATRRANDRLSVTPNTGRISQRADTGGYTDAIRWACSTIDTLLDANNEPAVMIPTSLIPTLETVANDEINSVLRTGAISVQQSVPTGEAGFVAAFVLGAVPAIAAVWKPLLKPHGLSVRMSGVFCHQTPIVSFTDRANVPRRCELADLLVVVDDLTSGTATTRRAVLIQAKMAQASGGQRLTTQGDVTQLDLFSYWPSFMLPPGFAPGQRDFQNCSHPGLAVECGRYGLIDNPPNPAWHQHAPAVSMPAGGDELGTFLARMMEGRSSYGREATGTRDDWSRTVDELMKVTAGLAFTYSSGLKGRHPRGNSAVAFVIASDDYPLVGWASGPPPTGGRPEQAAEGPPSEGINLVHIGVTRH